ncbi:hypothetical protein IQ238_03425 [Pleurocapsales cyanobacterium LEGE 06147]|nr:hypothetical protein [Pleurocapsales cyanobacterium LEGE 06147]
MNWLAKGIEAASKWRSLARHFYPKSAINKSLRDNKQSVCTGWHFS